jgi:uncharacterized protein (DUF2126 family)
VRGLSRNRKEIVKYQNTDNTASRVLKIIAGGPSFATQSVRQALEDAARSLETISELAGRDETLMEPDQVRGYAASRAHMARAALAQRATTNSHPQLEDDQTHER